MQNNRTKFCRSPHALFLECKEHNAHEQNRRYKHEHVPQERRQPVHPPFHARHELQVLWFGHSLAHIEQNVKRRHKRQAESQIESVLESFAQSAVQLQFYLRGKN